MSLRNTKSVMLAFLIVATTGNGEAFADSGTPAPMSARFLGGTITAQQVLKAIHEGFDPATMKTGRKTDVNSKYGNGDKSPTDELVGFFKIAEPAFLPDHLLVLEILSDSMDGTFARGFFNLLKVVGGTPKVSASERIVDGTTEDGALSWSGGGNGRSGLELKFELANYKLNETERAFGYRITTWDGGTGADSGDETVVLYRRTPQGLSRIFSAALASHDSDGEKDVESKAVLSVASTMHDGFYDWQIKGKKRNKGAWKPSKAETYVWQNGQYVIEGKAR
jgi:hypothetical protein